ncbi:MAG: 4a-hydroxytetrahydrobiopterin dehydratase [Chitinophagales bacterium]|nr:4a-hydroxytetrahydrobiopterin dehydratase [Chitinophagales bacterium]
MNPWIEKDNSLFGTFEFENFTQAFGFMTQIAIECEKINHHPEWSNTYNQVSIKLTTHDAGNRLTEKDRILADIITKIYHKTTKP